MRRGGAATEEGLAALRAELKSVTDQLRDAVEAAARAAAAAAAASDSGGGGGSGVEGAAALAEVEAVKRKLAAVEVAMQQLTNDSTAVGAQLLRRVDKGDTERADLAVQVTDLARAVAAAQAAAERAGAMSPATSAALVDILAELERQREELNGKAPIADLNRIARRFEVGLHALNSVRPIARERLVSTLGAYEVKHWFQNLPFLMQLVPLHRGRVEPTHRGWASGRGRRR